MANNLKRRQNAPATLPGLAKLIVDNRDGRGLRIASLRQKNRAKTQLRLR